MSTDDSRYSEMLGLAGLDSDSHEGMQESAMAGGLGDAAEAWAWNDESPAHGGQPFRPPAVYSPAGSTISYGQTVSMSDKGRRQMPGNERMKRRSSLDAGFDRYLSRQLHEIYDPVLTEAIPDEIATLLEQFDQRPNGKDKAEESD